MPRGASADSAREEQSGVVIPSGYQTSTPFLSKKPPVGPSHLMSA
jgi:hypothetical protein